MKQAAQKKLGLGGALLMLVVNLALASLPAAHSQPPSIVTLIDGLNVPNGVFVDGDGNVYFVEFGSLGEPEGTVKIIKKGSGAAETILEGLPGPYAVAVDSKGRLFFTDRAGTLKVLNPGSGEPETLLTGVGRIYGMAIDGEDNLYLVRFGSPFADVKDGALLKLEWVGEGQSFDVLAANLDHPVGVAVDEEGNVYVAEHADPGSIKVYTAGGELKTLASGLKQPAGLAVDREGNIYFAEAPQGTIKRLTVDGDMETVALDLRGPWSLAMDAEGNLYLTERTVDGSIKYIRLVPPSEPVDLTAVLLAGVVILICVPLLARVKSARK